jgi:hypothetical protein
LIRKRRAKRPARRFVSIDRKLKKSGRGAQADPALRQRWNIRHRDLYEGHDRWKRGRAKVAIQQGVAQHMNSV